MPLPPTPPDLQSQLDAITAQTRSLVQPERLAVTETAVRDLYATGIEAKILPVGALAPSFALPNSPHAAFTGKLVRSDDLLALGPLIVKFFRGRWCPYCITELEAWQRLYPEVRERGALLVAISPQLPRQNDFTVQQHNLTFPVLSDAGANVAAAFGITYTVSAEMQRHYRSILVNIPFLHGQQRAADGSEATWRLPLPATFVIKKDRVTSENQARSTPGDEPGTIVFAEAHADHRVRPNPADVLAAL